MEIKSVNNSRQPNYPTIELFVKHPELLSRNIPNSWLKNQFVATSLAAFLLSSCGTNTAKKSEEVEVVDTLKTNNPTSTSQKKKTDNNVTNVAPVFVHGEGSGAIGCIVMSPPVFISEDEAIKIILDKLKAEGYNFSRENSPTFSFEVLPIANERDEPKGKAKIELKMDAYNSNSKWAIQFISTGDHDKFKNEGSSVVSYDLKQVAEIINQELKKQKKTNAVVFYDPVTRAGDDQDKYKQAKADARKLLLAQVDDFIKWLKTNNITIE
jgi:hypothetical protein